jgi:hypothetical protein
MDELIANYVENNLGEHYHPVGFSGEFTPPLQSAKHMLEFLSPLVSFHILKGDLSIFLTNTTDTQITAYEYEYYMQMILYPQFIGFLKRQETICRKIYESFYPNNRTDHSGDISYTEALPYLKKLYNLTEDPRTLLKMERYGDEIHIKKEPWFQFLLRKSPFCKISETNTPSYGTLSDYYDGIKAYIIRYSSLDSHYDTLVTYLGGQSVTEKI